jgi:MarR family transcriptional regulator, lower aerobic nicotinate degradation pathway regulator
MLGETFATPILRFEPAGGADAPVVPGDPMRSPAIRDRGDRQEPYVLDEQVGFVLRQAQQRHTTIFAAEMIEDLTPTQWAALAKLREVGDCSQNHLGRLTAMDAATIKGVIDRLTGRGFTTIRRDPRDGRRILVALTPAGSDLYDRAAPIAAVITEKTLEPLGKHERSMLVALLRRLA